MVQVGLLGQQNAIELDVELLDQHVGKIVDDHAIVGLGGIGNGSRGGDLDPRVTAGRRLEAHFDDQLGFFDVHVIVRGRHVKGDGLDALVHGAVMHIPSSLKAKIDGRHVKKLESYRGHGQASTVKRHGGGVFIALGCPFYTF